LSKGLTFIPTPRHIKNVKDDIKACFVSFLNRAAINIFSSNQSKSDNFFFKKHLKDNINYAVYKNINSYNFLLNEASDIINNFNFVNSYSNLSTNEMKALDSLRQDETIIIKKSDKSVSFVILNKLDYILEANRQLSNTSNYKVISDPLYPATSVIISNTLRIMLNNKVITKRVYNMLIPPDIPIQRTFYLLPKIHKPPDEWIVPFKVPKGRPIVSDSGSESEAVAKFVDFFLQPIVRKQLSYIRDTNHFQALLAKLQVPSSCFLFTLDVESLYTNIPILDGIKVIENFLNSNQVVNRPDTYLVELLNIIMLTNDFGFNGINYLQLCGTAMGKRCAPSFANLYMADFEAKALSTYAYKPLAWYRFIDDVFGIWVDSLDNFNSFVDHLNNITPTITFTSNFSAEKVVFLDVLVTKIDTLDSCKLMTSINFKITDTHWILSKQSNHPPSTFKSIVFSQILRFASKSSTKLDFDNCCNIAFKVWMTRGYNLRFLRNIKYQILHVIGYLPSKTWQKGFFRCHVSDCRFCKFGNFGTTFTGRDAASLYLIEHNLNCFSYSIIYLIVCKICGPIYVGETKNTLRERIAEHMSDIRIGRDTPLASHFNSSDHIGLSDFSFVAIDCFFPLTSHESSNTLKRRTLEAKWIKRLGTLSPNGVNTKFKGQPNVLILPYTPVNRVLGYKLSNICTDSISDMMVAFSRHRNLKEMLCPSKIK
jgi:hypothetical protein